MSFQKVWTEDYRISSYLVNLRGRAGLYAIQNLIQDVGWMHAFHLGIRLPPNQAWVFTRQKLVMNEWPAWNQVVQIRTWLRPADTASPFVLRDYELSVDGRKIGFCTSTFTVIDMSTRKLASVDWSQFSQIWQTENLLDLQPGKISPVTEVEDLSQFEVRNSDIDMNQHVNNTKYSQWILDSLPLEVLKQGVDLHEFEINFLAEMKSGDKVTVQRAKDQMANGQTKVQFQGIRKADGKVAFTAQMLVS